MNHQTVALRIGEYNSCGVTLRIEKDGSDCVVSVRESKGVCMSWRFSGEGVFQILEAKTVPPQIKQNASVFLVCKHIVNDDVENRVVIKHEASSAGWVCCVQCVSDMLSGGSVIVMDNEIVRRKIGAMRVLDVNTVDAKELDCDTDELRGGA